MTLSKLGENKSGQSWDIDITNKILFLKTFLIEKPKLKMAIYKTEKRKNIYYYNKKQTWKI